MKTPKTAANSKQTGDGETSIDVNMVRTSAELRDAVAVVYKYIKLYEEAEDAGNTAMVQAIASQIACFPCSGSQPFTRCPDKHKYSQKDLDAAKSKAVEAYLKRQQKKKKKQETQGKA